LKDSDVTWLYGPLHTVIRTEEDPFLTPRKSTAEETLGLMLPLKNQKPEKKPVLKSALKKVTTVDLLKRSATELSSLNPLNETASLEQKPKHHRKISISEVNNQLHAISPEVLATHRQPRLRFNHEVEQCIALTDEERDHEDIEEQGEERLAEHDDSSEGDEDTDQIITTHVTYAGSYSDYTSPFSHRKSIKKIAPARLKKSQSDGDTDDVSSISSTSTASSVGCITRSPVATSPFVFDQDDDELSAGLEEEEEEDEDEEEEEDSEDDACHITQSFYNRPTPGQSLREQESVTIQRPIIQTVRSSSSSNSITQPYKEKSNVAEPALVTMHQTATDIQSTKNSTLFNNIATWAASYLWPNESSNNTISRTSSPFPQPSSSTSIIPSKSSSAIPIERPFAHPTSSNSSSL
jgi:hypothetical protein